MKQNIHGWVCCDKPKGLSSMQVTSIVKRLFNARKAGHAGTLDPFATGILPIALGEATKTIPYLMDHEKEYLFTTGWGVETNSDDCEGVMTQSSPQRPDEEAIRLVLSRFTGDILQTPPDYSAVHINGERAYALARKGIKPDIKPRNVWVRALDLLEEIDAGHHRFRVQTGKGVYVRALARDMGRALGCWGHVTELERTRVGPFCKKESIPLDALREMVHIAREKILLPVAFALDGIPALGLSKQDASFLRQGKVVSLSRPRGQMACEGRLDDLESGEAKDGRLVLAQRGALPLGLARLEAGKLRPIRMFNIEMPGDGHAGR